MSRRAPALLAGCRLATPAQLVSAPRRACVDLANTFVLVAESRDRGTSREAQVELAHASAGGPALHHWLRIIDLVYRFDGASSQEIGWTVLDACSVDGRGRAVVRTLWPGP